MPQKIIGLTGKAGCGKSTVAGILVQNHGFQKIAFADALKNVASALLAETGLSFAEINHHLQQKQAEIPRLGVTMRTLLQTLGTDWGRNMISPHVWIACAGNAMAKWGDDAKIVIDDVRFRDEAEWISSRGGVLCAIESAHRAELSAEERSHVSESGVYVGDLRSVTLYNHGDLADLHNSVFAVAACWT